MPRSAINLEALRAVGARSPFGARRSWFEEALTRRRALGMAGAAGLGAAPMGRLVRAFTLGGVELVEGPGRIAFRMGGRDLWAIDTRWFAGSPSLRVAREPERVRILLRGARFAGTPLPADLTCDLRRVLGGWRIRISHALGGFNAEGALEPWLRGQGPLRGTVRLDAELSLHAGAWLALRGVAAASFSSSWELRLDAQHVATLRGVGPAPLVADALILQPLPAEAPSLLRDAAARRTALTLWRGSHAWSPTPNLQLPAGARLLHGPASFDELSLECGETRTGATRYALAITSESGGGIAYQPHHTLSGGDGAPFTLPLRTASYVLTLAPNGRQEALVARLGEEPARLVMGGHTLSLADSDEAPALEFTSDGPARVTAAVASAHLSLRGALVEAPLPPRALLAFTGPGLADTTAGAWAALRLDSRQLTIDNPIFTVIRPDDMLVLTFECADFTLRIDDVGQGTLVPKAGAPNAALIVRFPPQHIQEQAFFRRVDNYRVPAGDPDASSDTAKGQETPRQPANAYISQESRLVFGLAPGMASIPFTLESLLDWQQFTPLLPGTARPPVHVRQRVTITRSHAGIGASRSTITANATSPLAQLIKSRILHPEPSQPGARETAIEAPWRLIMSPVPSGAWLHAFTPVTDHGRTELWHTRLGVKLSPAQSTDPPTVVDMHYVYQPQGTGLDRKYVVTGEILSQGRPVDAYGADAEVPDRVVRAVWSRDYQTGKVDAKGSPAFRGSLNANDRYQIVRLSADFSHEALKPAYQPAAIAANRLMLSGLGAWLDLRGSFNSPSALSLSVEEWVHRGAMGRDSYVRVVYQGYLFPFGHRASLVKVTERKFFVENGKNVAYLIQRMFIVVREPIKQFRNTGLVDLQVDRQMPFSQVRSTTITTPDLDIPLGILAGRPPEDAFVPRVAGSDFQFHLVGADVTGQTVEFTAPLAFITANNDLAFNAGAMAGVQQYMQGDSAKGLPARTTYQTAGQDLAFAESAASGDTTLHAMDVTFSSVQPRTQAATLKSNGEPAFYPVPAATLKSNDQPAFYPVLAQASVKIPALEALLRTGQAPRVRISEYYLNYGFDDPHNVGQIYLEMVDSGASKVSFVGSDSSPEGSLGVISPAFNIAGMSRTQGPVGNPLDQIASGTFNKSNKLFYNNFFDPSQAKILGGLTLGDVAETPTKPSDLPMLLQGNDHEDPKDLDSPLTHRTYSLSWKPNVKAFGPYKPDTGNVDATKNGALSVIASSERDYTGKPGAYKVEGKLTNFALDLFQVIITHFDEFSFSYAAGDKLKVKPKGIKVEFGGPLAFVNDLKKIIPGMGDSGSSGSPASSGPASGASSPPPPDSGGGLDIGGPFVDLSVDHVDAGVRIHLPALSVGLFALTNIKFGMVFTVPFFGDPVTAALTFGSRTDPCHLEISGFTGGLFFGITVGLDGVHSLEAAIEFGASVSLNLGVASGTVYAMAGIYFKFTPGTPATASAAATPDVASLTGYFRAGGSVEVLGIASVSIELYIGLTYENRGGRSVAYGQATLTLEISVLFFSKSISVSVEREIGGSDPHFIDQFSHGDWDDYLAAFATA